MKLKLRDFLALSTSVYLISVCSKVLYPGFYTDILALYYRVVLPTQNGVPYHAYWLEYPAIPAIMIWISGLALDAQTYVWTMAFLLLFFVIGSVYFLYRTCTEFGLDRGRIVPFLIMAPSFIAMSYYNWDMVAVCFTCAALYYAFKKKLRISGFCLGLGFAAKAYPLLLLPAFLKEAKTWSERTEMALAAVLGGLLPNVPFVIYDASAWYSSNMSARGTVYVEDSIWMVLRYFNLINQDWLVNALVWAIIILAILHMTFSNRSLLLKSWVILAVTILVFPSYPPQYDLWLVPLFVLDSTFPLVPFLVFDFLDTSVILAWFQVDNPFKAWGPIWDLSVIRIALLVVIMIWVMRKTGRSVLDTVTGPHQMPVGSGNPPKGPL